MPATVNLSTPKEPASAAVPVAGFALLTSAMTVPVETVSAMVTVSVVVPAERVTVSVSLTTVIVLHTALPIAPAPSNHECPLLSGRAAAMLAAVIAAAFVDESKRTMT